jgi:hypothetical protein
VPLGKSGEIKCFTTKTPRIHGFSLFGPWVPLCLGGEKSWFDLPRFAAWLENKKEQSWILST